MAGVNNFLNYPVDKTFGYDVFSHLSGNQARRK